MKLIFWGLLIACLHFKIGTLDLIPSFLGWYFVLRGLRGLPPCSARDNARIPVWGMITLTATAWFLQIFSSSGPLCSAITLFAAFAEFYTLWLLIRTVAALEQIVSHRMPVDTLSIVWRAYLLCSIVLHIPLSTFLTVACAIITFGCKIAYLYWIWQAAKAYQEAMAHPIEFLPPEE